jgi:ornithine carbamoyltransferase
VSRPDTSNRHHLLDIDDLTVDELRRICELATAPLDELGLRYERKGVACFFEKPSARTRNSTEVAVTQLGGHPVYIGPSELGIDTRESAEDVLRTLACYHEVFCGRVYDHTVLERMAAVDQIPIVNLLSDQAHPTQAIADVLTIQAEFGSVEGKVVTYVGDSNNVTRSLALAVGAMGGLMRVGSPPGFQFDDIQLDRLRASGVEITSSDRLEDVLPGSDVVYTDAWISMGDEHEAEERLRAFEGRRVDAEMMASAPEAIFMHCLPAHRGEEVTDEVLDSPRSRIWPQAANRLASIRGILAFLADSR